MKNIIFLGSKPIGYHCLKFLLENKTSDYQVVAIVSNENSRFGNEFSLKKLAIENDIRFHQNIEFLEDIDIDFLISVQYHEILKSKTLKRVKGMSINLHMAPLPEYRGCNQFSFAIYNRERAFGTTLHVLDEIRFPIEDDDDVESLYLRTFEFSKELFKRSIFNIMNGEFKTRSQIELSKTRKSNIYYRKDIESIKKLDFGNKTDEVYLKVKATSKIGFTPPFAEVNGEKLYVLSQRMYDNLINQK